MTNTLDDQVAALKARLAAATRDRARAEHAHDAATAAEQAVRARLRQEFNVDTVEQARALLTDTETQLATVVGDLNTTLDDIGAPPVTQP